MKYDSKNKSDAVAISSASSDFVRYAKLVAGSRGRGPEEMKRLARGLPSARLQEAVHATKAAVAPGTSTDATWGGPLVEMANGFLASLKPSPF